MTECLGDNVCTNPRCATHGIEWTFDGAPGRPTRAEIEGVLGDHAEDNVIDCVCGWRDDQHNDDGDHLRHQAKVLHRFITEYGKVEK